MIDPSVSSDSMGHGGPAVEPFAPGAVGHVTSLDSPNVQQTKSEIRNLANEIAVLASSDISEAEFYSGFLPRIIAAMGAKAAGIWRVHHSQESRELTLEANHQLPEILLTAQNKPSLPHHSVLNCVVTESRSILVPPVTVTVEAERPTNPLDESLIITPIRFDGPVEYLVEVVHAASGGPAAQRGYLRFVAQMSDLMADFLRRCRLKEYRERFARVEDLEQWLVACASARELGHRFSIASNALAELTRSQQAVILARQKFRRNLQVKAVSGCRSFDSRSQAIATLASLVNQARKQHSDQTCIWLEATERRSDASSLVASPAESADLQALVDKACDLLGARAIGVVHPEDSHGWTTAFAFGADQVENARLEFEPSDSENPLGYQRLTGTFAALIAPNLKPGPLSRWSIGQNWFGADDNDLIRRLTIPVAVIAGLCALAVIPVPQRINATGTLIAKSKKHYYAPRTVSVERVHGDLGVGSQVIADQTLFDLQSDKLDEALRTVQARIGERTQQLEDLNTQIALDLNADRAKKTAVEGERDILNVQLQSDWSEREELEALKANLSIRARVGGRVSTFDAPNYLPGSTVRDGQLLLTTIDPNSRWELQVAVPEQRAALVTAQLEEDKAVPLTYCLTRRPDRILHSTLTELAPQVVPAAPGSPFQGRTIGGVASVPGAELPMKKDGATVRVTLECGKVPLGWLVFRDAYNAVSSQIRLML